MYTGPQSVCWPVCWRVTRHTTSGNSRRRQCRSGSSIISIILHRLTASDGYSCARCHAAFYQCLVRARAPAARPRYWQCTSTADNVLPTARRPEAMYVGPAARVRSSAAAGEARKVAHGNHDGDVIKFTGVRRDARRRRDEMLNGARYIRAISRSVSPWKPGRSGRCSLHGRSPPLAPTPSPPPSGLGPRSPPPPLPAPGRSS